MNDAPLGVMLESAGSVVPNGATYSLAGPSTKFDALMLIGTISFNRTRLPGN
jgi:hypothetical protein